MMGAMLSITGIFGMAAYSVSKRLQELGIRMALGAQRKEVLQTALGRPLKLLALGSAAGLLLGILATRVLASIVYQATPRDPLVLAALSWRCLFWACWPRGFRRNAHSQSTPWYSCARSDLDPNPFDCAKLFCRTKGSVPGASSGKVN